MEFHRSLPTHLTERKTVMLYYVLAALLFAIGEFQLSMMKEN
jgi:hypothetical protein